MSDPATAVLELEAYGARGTRPEKVRPLHELLPLAVPFTVHLDPANVCNFRCTFCPTGDPALLASVGRPKGLMTYDLFCKIIDDLSELVDATGRQVNRLHLYKDGEPLLNRRFIDMASYARSRNVARLIETTTNAVLITEELAVRLIKSGIDVVRISVEHVNDAGYKAITGKDTSYERIVEIVRFLFTEKEERDSSLKVYVKIADVGLSDAEKTRFLDDFGPISDARNIDQLMGWSGVGEKDFTLGLPVTTGMDGMTPLRDRKVCPEPFAKLAINFDGRVSVCCVDWSYGTIVGDLRSQSLTEIWRGAPLRQFRMQHLNGERETIPACASCQYVRGFPDHTRLDEHADEVGQRY